ncbi:sulfate adenylyltransferase subunit CysN [Paraferrimonas sp. SM1919]|uniref:sulfate adenylyltransferase subunit CysN n=1 Tax=Paraferrimonas sp. SM1919 TaxID=2662263 RepID=UPI0013D68227|nr:sulfate adenylyltransferase subunit CysN [Paraferrimonas sp. SM1919]
MNTQIAQQVQSDGVAAYLQKQQHKGLLRFLTCGSVDDGKSTLIGRLLHDSAQIYEDQLATLKQDSKRQGSSGEEIDLALLVDGLQAEREQGITIDVAYRYFSTQKRKFIIADTPGHEQYTRNMATGASTCDAAVLLVDAAAGLQTQTKRHAYIASLLGIKHFIIAVNKMDSVGFKQTVFEQIVSDFSGFAKALNDVQMHFVPVSALKGDNVVELSVQTPWYQGRTLLEVLETIEITKDLSSQQLRLPVQYVLRPDSSFRGFSGTIATGKVRPGDVVKVLPSGKQSTVDKIVTFDGELEQAQSGQAITLTLSDEIDISRGDVIVAPEAQTGVGNKIEAIMVWMNAEPAKLNSLYDIKIAGKKTQAKLAKIAHTIDVNTLAKEQAEVGLNAIAWVELELTEKIALDCFARSTITGSAILIDRQSNATLAGVMIQGYSQVQGQQYDAKELALNQFIINNYPHWGARDLLAEGK